MGLKPPSGLGPLPSLSMNRHMILGFIVMNRHRDDPAPPGRVIPNSYIPNSVSLFKSSLLYKEKGIPLTPTPKSHKAVFT